MRAAQLLQGRRRLVVVAVACIIVVGLGVGGWLVVAGDSGPSPDDTVRAFFDARRARDCERLVDLVSASSWPDGGDDLDRAGRVAQCRDVVDAEVREPDQIEVVDEDDDAAVVDLSLPVAGHIALAGPHPGIVVRELVVDGDTSTFEARAHAEGRLVREGGEWKVRLDHGFLHVGRSIERTVSGFAEAFRAGDCERMTDYVGASGWERGGGVTRDEHLARCVASVAVRDDATDLLGDVGEQAAVQGLRVSPTGDGRVIAEVQWGSGTTDTVPLHLDGGEWVLDAPPDRLGLMEVVPFLVDPVDDGAFTAGPPTLVSPETEVVVDISDMPEGDDAVERRSEHGFLRGVTSDYTGPEGTSLHVVVFEFADLAGALGYGELLASRVAQTSSPGSPTPVPSVAEARAGLIQCGGDAGDDCTLANSTVALGTRGRFLVGVNLIDFDDTYAPAAEALSRTEAILQAHLARLP